MLAEKGAGTASLDAKLLVGQALGFDALQLATRERELVSTLLASEVAALMQRRLTGEFVARIIGHKEFYGLEFGLNEATLEPRPDTELLVDQALKALPEDGRFVDLGTGSGCIPIAVLANRRDARGMATDIIRGRSKWPGGMLNGMGLPTDCSLARAIGLGHWEAKTGLISLFPTRLTFRPRSSKRLSPRSGSLIRGWRSMEGRMGWGLIGSLRRRRRTG